MLRTQPGVRMAPLSILIHIIGNSLVEYAKNLAAAEGFGTADTEVEETLAIAA